MTQDQPPPTGFGFAPAPIKREGAIANPDEFTWECDLSQCEQCRAKYLDWKRRYDEQENKR